MKQLQSNRGVKPLLRWFEMKYFVKSIFLLFALCSQLFGDSRPLQRVQDKPNVLFVIFDDMNDWTEVLSEPGLPTPNLERLANKSAVFTQAYCAAPICNPSRVSLMTGVHPSQSGIYHNAQIYTQADHWIAKVRNLPLHFQDNGYLAAGYGKLFHHRQAGLFRHMWSKGHVVPYSQEKEDRLMQVAEKKFDIDLWPHNYGWLPDDWDRDDPNKMSQDTENTLRVIELLKKKHDKPFFAALGIYKPHTRYYAAKRYWDRVPEKFIDVPPGYRPKDLEDVPPYGRMLALSNQFNNQPPYGRETPYGDYRNLVEVNGTLLKADEPNSFNYLVQSGNYRTALQAYLAAYLYADDLLGRVLDALEMSEYAKNTIVVMASDHGYHWGEKDHLHKFDLWERAVHVPFMISVPDVTDRGSRHATPVSLLDLYPTLVSLCGLSQPGHPLDGFDLSSVIKGQSEERGKPVVTTYYRNYHSVRDNRYRLIQYPDGTGELYDMLRDPWEWKNLYQNPDYNGVKKALANHIPIRNEPYSTIPWQE